MKHIAILLFLIESALIAQDYFPMQLGNSWTYCGASDSLHKRVYSLKDTLSAGGKKYYLYGVKGSASDTIRKDVEGNIWKSVRGVEYKWFDFSKDSGGTYTFPEFGPYIFNVTVAKHLTVKTYAGTFSECIEFGFDVPQAIDDEINYVLAPGLGIIHRFGAWEDAVLYGANINTSPLSSSRIKTSSPSSFTAMQNYPNPFNPITMIKYRLSASGFVRLDVFDVRGCKVATLASEHQDAGEHEMRFDGSNLVSGIYIYTLISANAIVVNKCTLIK
jgi:hypothetical protein